MVTAIQAIGDGDEDMYNTLVDGTMFDVFSAFEVRTMWGDIYEKHRLGAEEVFVPPQESLSNFQKHMILPDFALYPSFDGKIAGGDFDWSRWDTIVEVSGLWGVGLPGESTENDWWDWYRVSAVAFKEFVYKLLGLWEDVYYAVPNQPFIEGVSEGIPNELRDDEHYVIFNTTQAEPDLGELYRKIGMSERDIVAFENRLSPNIQPVKHERDLDNNEIRESQVNHTGIRFENTDENENVVIVAEDTIVFHGELGEVYITDGSIRVRESQWRKMNMIMLREYVADVLSQLEDDNIIEGLEGL
jgi:hypothetical protein